jgi:hypothetical protein
VKPRKPLAILAATAITGLGLTALASPAHAATTVTLTGTYDQVEGWSDPALAPSSASGTSFVFQNSTNVTIWLEGVHIEGSGRQCNIRGLVDCKVDAEHSVTFTISESAMRVQVECARGLKVVMNCSLMRQETFSFPTWLVVAVTIQGHQHCCSAQQFQCSATSTATSPAEGLNWGGAPRLLGRIWPMATKVRLPL